jgi:hypothetical protein
MIFDPKENIQVHFVNGRRCWLTKYTTEIGKQLQVRFNSAIRKVSGATNVKFGSAWQKDHYNHNATEKHEKTVDSRTREVRNR